MNFCCSIALYTQLQGFSLEILDVGLGYIEVLAWLHVLVCEAVGFSRNKKKEIMFF